MSDGARVQRAMRRGPGSHGSLLQTPRHAAVIPLFCPRRQKPPHAWPKRESADILRIGRKCLVGGTRRTPRRIHREETSRALTIARGGSSHEAALEKLVRFTPGHSHEHFCRRVSLRFTEPAPRSNNSSSTSRKLRQNRKYSHTAWLMISTEKRWFL